MSTSIEWTEVTWNPVTGCERVSAGCDNCYALTMARRLKAMGAAKYQRDGDPRTSGPGFGVTLHPDVLEAPLGWKKPRRVFVNSMSDLFHKDVTDEFIARVWQTMGAAPEHTYQILTKRHARMRSFVTRWYAGEIPEPVETRPVLGYPGYFVDTTGRVFGKRSDTRDGLSQDVGEQGHRRVKMHRADSPRSGSRELVHRLVLTTFVRPGRAGEQACHRNGDASDNRLSNLYWGRQSENWTDRIRHGNGQSWSKLSDDDVARVRQRGNAGESAYRIAQDYPVSDTQIRNILSGRQWILPMPGPQVVPPARAVLPSVWLGVSVEDQHWADIRIPALSDTPAAVRFISAEPLLGEISLYGVSGGRHALDWCIVGGESGPGARPCAPEWVRHLRDSCIASRVAFFFKQWGGIRPKAGGRILDGRTWDEFPRSVP